MIHKKAGGEAEILHQYISKAIGRELYKEDEYDFSTTHDSAFTCSFSYICKHFKNSGA